VGEDAIRDDGRDARLTVAAAAERLGITKEAVRKRISRGTLRSDKDTDGTVLVYIPASGTPSGTASEAIGRDELVELLRAQLEDLRADRDAWRDQARRSDYMASAAMDRTRELESRIRELEAPSEARESPERVEEEPDRVEETHSTTQEAQEGVQTRQPSNSADAAPIRTRRVGEEVVGGALAQGVVALGTAILPLFNAVAAGVFAVLAAADSKIYLAGVSIVASILFVLIPVKVAPVLERKLSERTYTLVGTAIAVLLLMSLGLAFLFAFPHTALRVLLILGLLVG
jgi:hypothetical protein